MQEVKCNKENIEIEQNINANNIIQNTNPNNTSNTPSTVATPISHQSICSWLSRFYYQHPAGPIPSFTVLNNDFTLTFADKPNAIVHPMRRSKPTSLTLSTEYPYRRDLRVTAIRNAIQSNPSLNPANVQIHSNERNFVEELNRKLHHLHSKATHQNSLNQRPLFITTVPRGRFLPPPPPAPPATKDTLFATQQQQRKANIYVYSSHPVVYKYPKCRQESIFNSNLIGKKIHTTATHPNNNKKNRKSYQRSISISNKSPSSEQNDNNTNDDENDNDINNDDEQIAILSTNKQKPAHTIYHKCYSKCRKSEQQYHNKRENPPIERYKNIMFDKRVVRGSNFCTKEISLEYDPFDSAAESRRRLNLRRKSRQKNLRNVLGTPPPVPGRLHEIIQTDKYLEDVAVRPFDLNVQTQTDLFLEIPPIPPYIPSKSGKDASTEIPDGDLFHFEAEAQPIIDVLVDSTIELSILEVTHEREIACIRKRQNELLAQREAELAELRRLEAEEMRLQAEKERRVRQDTIAKSLDLEMQKEVTTAKLLQGKILDILPEILDNLEPAMDNTMKDKLFKSICPWLSEQVANEVGKIVNSRDMLTIIIKDIVKKRAEVYAGYKEEVETAKFVSPITVEAEMEAEEEYECESINTDDYPAFVG